MTKKQKQQPVKRKYTKKGTKNSIKNLEWVDPTPHTTQKDNEIKELAIMCSIMDNLDTEQKQRFLKFLCGRYYNFMD